MHWQKAVRHFASRARIELLERPESHPHGSEFARQEEVVEEQRTILWQCIYSARSENRIVGNAAH